MNFYTFGSESAPKMLLIHGVICPWQIWDDVAAHYQNDYRVIVVELDGHTQDAPTEFVSVGQEAQRIEDWLLENGMGELDTVCGLSMGGGIAGLLWQNGRIAIKNLVLDGAPLAGLSQGLSRDFTPISSANPSSATPRRWKTAKRISCPKSIWRNT